METRRQNGPEEDPLTISPRNNRSKKTENSIPIPIDVIIDVFLRLPVKSIARCRCVSKLWASILRRPDFTDSFMSKSSARLQLLFAFHNNGELFFFSAPQPSNCKGYPFHVATTASYLMKVQFRLSFERFTIINGLIFLRDERVLEGKKNTVSVICNPSTGQSLTLPTVNTWIWNEISSYFGYDPIEKHYKVLSLTSTCSRKWFGYCEEYKVLTLGAGKMSWRTIKCGIPHYPLQNGICIHGVLYYPAARHGLSKVSMIVCFDVRSEKFRFVKVMGKLITALHDGFLTDYNGKLGAFSETRISFNLWVLEDAEKEEWSEYTRFLGPSDPYILGYNNSIRFVGVTRTNEIVKSPCYQDQTDPFYISYCNIESQTVVRIGIQGVEAFKGNKVYTLVDYVEDVKLIQMI